MTFIQFVYDMEGIHMTFIQFVYDMEGSHMTFIQFVYDMEGIHMTFIQFVYDMEGSHMTFIQFVYDMEGIPGICMTSSAANTSVAKRFDQPWPDQPDRFRRACLGRVRLLGSGSRSTGSTGLAPFRLVEFGSGSFGFGPGQPTSGSRVDRIQRIQM